MEQLENINMKILNQHKYLCDKYNELEKLNSTEKNKTKKFQDSISKKIELKKLENRIKILTIIIQELNTISSLYEIGYNEIEINDNIITFLEDEYKQLDILSTKKVLTSEFEIERQKGIKKYNFETLPLFGGLSCSLTIGIPFLKFINLPYSLLNISLPLIIPGIIGGIGTCYFMTRLTKRKIKVFNNLNNQLGENKIAFESDESFKEQLALERLINKKINSIVTMIIMNIREFQYFIETTNKDNNKQILNTTNKQVSIDNYYDKEIKEQSPITIKKVLILKRK